MTSPLSPEAVAQMVAGREAAYQSYLNEITTNGNSRLDNIILSLSGNEVQQRHIATQIDMAFQAGWHHMLTSLAAENATLRAENEELDFLRHEGGPDSVAAMDQLKQDLSDMRDNAESAYRRGYWAGANVV